MKNQSIPPRTKKGGALASKKAVSEITKKRHMGEPFSKENVRSLRSKGASDSVPSKKSSMSPTGTAKKKLMDMAKSYGKKTSTNPMSKPKASFTKKRMF